MMSLTFGRTFRVVLAFAMLGLTGCENGNLFGKLHDSGDSGDTQTLISDGNNALRAKDYAGALKLFERVLAKDGGNSQALYGAATAQIGLSGLNFGQLLANILNNDGTASTLSLADAIHEHSFGYGSLAIHDKSVLRGFNLTNVVSFTRIAINYLRTIVRGLTDGVIPSNDVATLIDLAIASIINATATMVNADVFDIINDGGSFKVVSKVNAAAYCGDPGNSSTIVQAARDLCNAYSALNRAAMQSSSADTVITRFRADVDSLIQEGLDGDGTNDLDAACVTVLNNAGITAANFRAQSDL